jgi:hypothetical protein
MNNPELKNNATLLKVGFPRSLRILNSQLNHEDEKNRDTIIEKKINIGPIIAKSP